MMADREHRVVAYLTAEENRRLREWADETDKSVSHLLREAIREYLDHDRGDRVEERLDAIDETLSELTDTLDTDTAHTHKPSSGMKQGSKSVEKGREIIRRLQKNHDAVIPTADVERAIEDIAGADDRTLRKYKALFRRRGLLFEHPGESAVWTTNTDEWLEWLNKYGQLNGPGAVQDTADAYPVSTYSTADGVQIEIHEDVKQ